MLYSILAPLFATSLLWTSVFSSPAPSEGCGNNGKSSLVPGGPSKSFTFTSNAGDGTLMRRRLRIYLPESYQPDQPAPLVVAFHSKHRNGTSFEIMTDFSKREYNGKAIVVYPDGIDLNWTGDPFAPKLKKNNDVKYTGELIDHIEENFCVDKRRVYAAGFAAGGGLVNLLACDPILSNRIAAFLSASGSIWTDKAMKQKKAVREPLFNADRCKPGRKPIPLLQFHGDEDLLVDYNGNSFDGKTVPIPEWLEQWRERNGCAPGNKTTQLYDGRVTKYDWDCGRGAIPVLMHYLLHGVDHTWPTVSLLKDDEVENQDKASEYNFDAAPIIMNFFRTWELPEEFVTPNKAVEPLPEAKDDEEIPEVKDDVEPAEPRGAETAEESIDKADEKTKEKIKDEL